MCVLDPTVPADFPQFHRIFKFPISKHPPALCRHIRITLLYSNAFMASLDLLHYETTAVYSECRMGISTVLNVPSKYFVNQLNNIKQPLFRAALLQANLKLLLAVYIIK